MGKIEDFESWNKNKEDLYPGKDKKSVRKVWEKTGLLYGLSEEIVDDMACCMEDVAGRLIIESTYSINEHQGKIDTLMFPIVRRILSKAPYLMKSVQLVYIRVMLKLKEYLPKLDEFTEEWEENVVSSIDPEAELCMMIAEEILKELK